MHILLFVSLISVEHLHIGTIPKLTLVKMKVFETEFVARQGKENNGAFLFGLKQLINIRRQTNQVRLLD